MTNTSTLNFLETPHLFLSQTLQKPPTEIQSDILDLLVDHPKTPLVIDKQKRQIGFTTALAFYLVWEALNNPLKNIIICGTFNRRKYLLEEIRDITKTFPKSFVSKQISSSVSFGNGSSIRIGDIGMLHGTICSMFVGLDLEPDQQVYIRAEHTIKVYEGRNPIEIKINATF